MGAREPLAYIADLGKLGIERDHEAPDGAFTYLLALCRTHRLTSYDALYLDLALPPLATLAEDLRKPRRSPVSSC